MSRETIPRRIMEVIRKQIDDLAELGVLEHCVKIFSGMPDSVLFDTQRRAVFLKELWAKGSLVISFYRGGW
jgi:hypothetical protein